MNLYITIPEYVVWLLVMSAQAALLLLLLKGGRVKIYPAFTCYVAFCNLRSLTLMLVAHYGSLGLYYNLYCAGAVVAALILLAVAHEVFRHVFAPYASLPNGTLPWCLTIALVGADLAVALALYLPIESHTTLFELFIRLERVTAFVLLAAFAAVVLFSSVLGLPLRRRTEAVATGFLFYFGVSAVVNVLTSLDPLYSSRLVQLTPRVALVIALAVWFAEFLLPEPAPAKPSPEVIQFLENATARLNRIRRHIETESVTDP